MLPFRSADKKKRIRQTRDAEWDMARAKQEKLENKIKSVEEKKKDLEMLQSYKPWGRPGVGAPEAVVKNRRTKSLEPEHLGAGETTVSIWAKVDMMFIQKTN